MHAESSMFGVAARLAGAGVSFERAELDTFVHLRSAGRGPELAELTQLAQDALGVDLTMVGQFAELAPASDAAAVAGFFALRTRPSEIVAWRVRLASGSPKAETGQATERCRALARESKLLHVVDATRGQAAFVIDGPHARALLQRVADDTSLPRTPGSAVRLRLADLHVTLAWLTDGRYVVIVDVLYAEFLSERVAYAAALLDPPQ